MKKLILGIVAVVCAQIMFQIFLAVDRSDAAYRARIASGPLVGPLSGPDATGPAVLPENVELARMDGSAITARMRPQRKAIKAQPLVNRRPVRRPFDPTNMVAIAQAPAKPDFLAPQADRYTAHHAVTRETANNGNKSFFAKALPIIKKPYGWLKAVGSKLK